MKKIFGTAAILAAGFAQAAVAGEVTGGALGYSYSAFSDDSAGNVDKNALAGSVEYGFDRQFAVQGDLSFMKFGATDFDGKAFTLHGIYHLDDFTSFGAFITREDVESLGQTSYGLEVGHEMGLMEVEGYIAHGEADDIDGNLFGISALYNATESFSFGLGYDNLDVDSVDASRVALVSEYAFDRVVISGELGQADIEDLGSESYFELGARMTFGANRGTTFGKRGFLEILPGL
ncbi:hypothetical protein [Albirhodobacter sp. R86504]|uniref:hypothetical protein n=1 Tax=Albirhodobacter sp. R86504 TaxID=3093848 RepID=UPI00366B77B6